jgi:hypothetical protein
VCVNVIVLSVTVCVILTRLANQHLQYGLLQPQGYIIAQNEVVQHAPLNSPSSSMSHWPMGQVPTTGAAAGGPPLSALSPDPMYHPNSCCEDQTISATDHRHAATEDHFQPGLVSACVGTATYPTAGLMHPEADNTTFPMSTHATAPPALVPNPAIAHHQSKSGHDLVPQDVTARPEWYGVSTRQHSVGR